MLYRIYLLLLLTYAPIHAIEWQLNDSEAGWSETSHALEYFHHSELQRQLAWKFLAKFPPHGHEEILDIGSGDGKTSAMLSHFLSSGQVIGADISSEMLNLARRTFPNSEYPNLSFVRAHGLNFDAFDLEPGKKFDRIYALWVMHLVPDPAAALTQLKKSLKEDGELFLVLTTGASPAFFKAAKLTFEQYGFDMPWNKPAKCVSMRTLDGARHNLASAGWTVSYATERTASYRFATRSQMVHWCIGTMSANWNIPTGLSSEFFESMMDHLLELDPGLVDEEGTYHFQLGCAYIKAE